jgi:hypothetical protein
MTQGKQDNINKGEHHQPGRGSQGGEGGRPAHQIDDNQDDLGRDVNDPGKVANDINKDADRRGAKQDSR